MKRNLRKWVAIVLSIINLLILMTITNNSFLVDTILFIIFCMNGYIILKYDHKYINIEDDDYDRI